MPPGPTLSEIDRIAALADPAQRNLQITQSYHELSAQMVARSATAATWCTFATWASRQAGQTIRKEDLLRQVESRLRAALKTHTAVDHLLHAAHTLGVGQEIDLEALVIELSGLSRTVQRSSDAVGRGNQKVFAEIGHEFARFFADCLEDAAPDAARLEKFCQGLRPGDPPDGQRYLRQAFTNYYQAFFEPEAKTRQELILLANLEIGFHEQTRLQPEIAESLDAGLATASEVLGKLLRRLFPITGYFTWAYFSLRRMLGSPSPLELALQTYLEVARVLLRQVLTDVMMTLNLPPDNPLRLRDDLPVPFPPELAQIANPELIALLELIDPSPDSRSGSGARDWADLPDRIHFITDFFRSYQLVPELFSPPYTPEQAAAIKAGQMPAGRL